MTRFDCPNCGMTLEVGDDESGKLGKCPKCGNVVPIPSSNRLPEPDAELVQARMASVAQGSPMDELGAVVAGQRPAAVFAPPQQDQRTVRTKSVANSKATSGLGVIALVMGILACIGFSILGLIPTVMGGPIIESEFFAGMSCVLAAFGLLFGFIGLLVSGIGRRYGVGTPLMGFIVSLASFCVFGIVDRHAGLDRKLGAGPSVRAQSPELEVSAADICADYNAFNRLVADQRYTDRVIVVSGRVEEVLPEMDKDAIEIWLIAGNGQGRVTCKFGKEHAASLARLSKGQQIKVKGKCVGREGVSVGLRGCVLE